MRRGSDLFASAVAVLFGIALLCALAYRFRFGAELTDETFSIALPYRFVLGDRPFIDEVSTAQSAGLIVFPFTWLFVKLKGGTAGLVLFARALHFFFKVAAAVSVFLAARRWLTSKSAQIAVSFVPFTFVPHSIPNVGYNALGATFLVVGGFLSAAAIAEESPNLKLLVGSGVGYGLAALAYPPVVAAPLLATVLVLFCAPKRRLAAVVAMVGGGAIVLLLVSPALVPAGISGIKASFNFGSELVPRPRSKFLQVLSDWWTTAQPLVIGTYAACIVLWRLRSRALTSIVVPVLVLVLVTWFGDLSSTALTALHTVTWAGLLAPALVLTAGLDSVFVRGALLVCAPSIVAGLFTAYASSNQTTNGCIGLYPAATLLCVAAVRALDRARTERIWAFAPAALFAGMLVWRSYQFVYRDAPIEQLTTVVKSGPFKGIRTSAARAAIFAELEGIANKYDREDGHVLINYENPGAYLFSRMRPSTNTVWPLSYFGQASLLEYWRAHANGKGIVIKVHGSARGPLVDPVVEAPGRLLERTPHFSVYRDEP